MTPNDLSAAEARVKRMGESAKLAAQRAQAARESADAVLQKFQKAGADILHDPNAADEIQRAYEKAEGAAALYAQAREEQQKAMTAYAAIMPTGPGTAGPAFGFGSGGIGGPVGGDPLALTFGPDDLYAAHAALIRKQPYRLGPSLNAALDTSSVPMSDVASYRLSDVWPFLRERPSVLALFPQEGADRGTVIVYRGNAGATAAAPVAAGAVKPTSSPTWEPVEIPIETIAHLATANLQAMADYAGFMQFVGGEMMAGLATAIDTQLISGTGSTPQLTGLLHSGCGTYDRDATNVTRHDAVLAAITSVRVSAYVEPTVIVAHPTDLMLTLQEKAALTGNYLSPTDSAELPTLWGVRVVATTAITLGTAIVMNPAAVGTVFMRQGPVLEVNPCGDTEWERNQASLRNEARLALGVVRPEAACVLTF